MRLLRTIVIPLVLLASVSAQENTETTFKVDVKLVNVFVTVTDPQGAPIGNLVKNDFSLTEDGIPQKISVFSKESQLPLSIVLAVDTSSSTRKDIRLELEAARRFIHSMIRPQDAVAFYTFATNVSEMTPFTSKLRQLDSAINEVQVGGATSLYDAIYLGAKALINRQGRKVLVLITDGGDTASSIGGMAKSTNGTSEAWTRHITPTTVLKVTMAVATGTITPMTIVETHSASVVTLRMVSPVPRAA